MHSSGSEEAAGLTPAKTERIESGRAKGTGRIMGEAHRCPAFLGLPPRNR